MPVSPKRILVLGGAGFIGGALVRRLLERDGAAVTVLDDLSAGSRERLPDGGRIDFVRGSILDEGDLERAFAGRPEVVVNMAASFANLRSVEAPVEDLRVNAEGTIRALRRAREAGAGLFVQASSSCIYGDAPGPLDEVRSPHAPYTPYAISKLAAEQYVSFERSMHGLPAVILRYFNCYGPGERPGRYRGVVANFASDAIAGRPIEITGSGDESRQFLYIDDAVRATILAIEAGDRVSGLAFNVASGRDTTIHALAAAIVSLAGSPSPIRRSGRRGWDRVASRSASTDRARDLLGFTAACPLEEGLRATVEDMRSPGWPAGT